MEEVATTTRQVASVLLEISAIINWAHLLDAIRLISDKFQTTKVYIANNYADDIKVTVSGEKISLVNRVDFTIVAPGIRLPFDTGKDAQFLTITLKDTEKAYCVNHPLRAGSSFAVNADGKLVELKV